MMNHHIEMHDASPVIVCGAGMQLQSENDALELVALSMEHGTGRILLDAGSLPDEFFRLRNGLAGAVLQKFVNYGLRVAAVLPADISSQGRFGEMVGESNRGSTFRVFQKREVALDWLAGG